jgi:hypothetical protein
VISVGVVCSIGVYVLNCPVSFRSWLNCSEAELASGCFGNCTCVPCAAGTASIASRAFSVDTCLPCGTGLVSTERSSSCTACLAGKFASTDPSDTGGGQDVQVQISCCAIASAPSKPTLKVLPLMNDAPQILAGATVCNVCPAGFFVNTAASILCKECAIGKVGSL